MLSVYKLEIFSVVVSEGSFSAAAERLYMTQSAISQHIQDLESQLGTKLFKRGRRGVTMTSAGETLYDYTRSILRLVTEAESAVTTVENLTSGQVSIGTTPGISLYLLADWFQTFQQRFPALKISMKTDITSRIIDEVLEHRLDVGFVEGEINRVSNPRLGQIPLKEIEQFVIVGQGHPLWHDPSVSIQDLHEQAFITRQPNSDTRIWLDGIFNDAGISPHYVAELDNPESIKRAVMSGMGITVLPEYAITSEEEDGRVRALPVRDHPLRRSLKVVWDQDIACSAITKAFLTHLSDRYPRLVEVITAHAMGELDAD